MRALKGMLFVFAGLFILVTLISLLLPGRVVTTRAESMQGDSMKIFREISDLARWKDWQPVFMSDSAAISFSPVTDEQGSSAEWSSSGKKNKLIISEKKYPYVKILLKREGDNDLENILSVTPVQEQGNMQVQWEAINHLKWYPWQKFGGIFIEKISGTGYEEALKSLHRFMNEHQ